MGNEAVFPPDLPGSQTDGLLIWSANAYAIFGQATVVLIVTLMFVVPVLRILGRTGLSRWWTLLLIFSVAGMVVISWIVAFSRWQDRREGTA